MKILVQLALMFSLAGMAKLDAQNFPYHGTVNIVLRNQKGMILLTDSRLSGPPTDTNPCGLRLDNGRKLVSIDASTMASFAGLAAEVGDPAKAGSGGSVTYLTTPAMIEAESVFLANSHRYYSFEGKVASLIAAVQFELGILEMEKDADRETHLQTSSARASLAPLEIIVAGYDGGQVRSTKRIFEESQDGQRTIDTRSEEEKAAGEIRFLVSGPVKAREAVEERIQNPNRIEFKGESELQEYRQATIAHTEGSLSISQLTELATYLKKVAEDNAKPDRCPSTIGGPIQEATFSDGKVVPPNTEGLSEMKSDFSQAIVTDSNWAGNLLPSAIPVGAAYKNFTCIGDGTPMGGKISLDYAAVLSGTFKDCTFFYNGGPFFMDSQIQVEGGTVVLGPNLYDQSIALAELRKQLPGLKEIFWNKYPLPSAALWSIMWLSSPRR